MLHWPEINIIIIIIPAFVWYLWLPKVCKIQKFFIFTNSVSLSGTWDFLFCLKWQCHKICWHFLFHDANPSAYLLSCFLLSCIPPFLLPSFLTSILSCFSHFLNLLQYLLRSSFPASFFPAYSFPLSLLSFITPFLYPLPLLLAASHLTCPAYILFLLNLICPFMHSSCLHFYIFWEKLLFMLYDLTISCYHFIFYITSFGLTGHGLSIYLCSIIWQAHYSRESRLFSSSQASEHLFFKYP